MFSRLIIEKLTTQRDPQAVAAAVGSRKGAAILESSLPGGEYSRWSVFASDPVTTVTISPNSLGCPFERLANAIANFPQVDGGAAAQPYCCGWIGHFSYEAGLVAENIAAVPCPQPLRPLARFSLYDAVALHDAESNQWYAAAIDWPADFWENRPSARERIAGIKTIIEVATAQPPLSQTPGRSTLTPSISRRQYLDRVAGILDYIAAGDVYQVNLTQRFRGTTTLSPLDLYLRLREITPSSHGVFLSCDDDALISSSPELFLQTTERKIVTRPIKGTRPRSNDPIVDQELRADLQSAEKDVAELAMIVDLVRNDLGRICDYGSVRVTDPASIEHHPTVYHRVATVEGHLRDSSSLAEILRATCPGGSVTGAPKIRAMQIIAELETTPRGPYCGSIGWIGLEGSVSMNLAIRTIIQRGRVVDLHAGGGIVADSVAEDEYDEMMTKLSAMARAVGCALPTFQSATNFAGAGVR